MVLVFMVIISPGLFRGYVFSEDERSTGKRTYDMYCVGCHGTETGTTSFNAFHISPMSGQSPGNYSGLVVIQEIPRRVSFMQHLLTCQPPACAAGGEEMMKP